MMAAFKAEVRKLLTVRSTYIWTALAIALVIFFGFFVQGFRLVASGLHNPGELASDVTAAITSVAIFWAIIGVLLMTHEYRYNTIMYTLTASNSRSKVLASKLIVMTIYALLFSAVVGALSPVMSFLGVSLHAHMSHESLRFVPQTFHYGALVWQTLFYGWAMAMVGLVLAALIRNQVGAIVTLFIVPGVAEHLLGLLLKKNTIYLPFAALNQVVGQGDTGGHLTPGKAVVVFGTYLVVAWIIAWILFNRRDAN